MGESLLERIVKKADSVKKAFIGIAGALMLYASPVNALNMPELTQENKVKQEAGAQENKKVPLSGRIYFVSNREDSQFDIYSVNPDGSDIQRLTRTPEEEENLAVCREGCHLAFGQYTPEDKLWHIYTVNLKDNELKQETKDRYSDRHPAFGPNHRLYFSRKFGKFTDSICTPLDNGEVQRLTALEEGVSDICPSVSPNGEELVYVRDITKPVNENTNRHSEESGLWVANKDGTNQRKITSDDMKGYYFNPEWSPQGDKIAYETRIGGAREIAVINPNGDGFTNITNYSAPVPEGVCAKPLSGGSPAWAGEFIIFAESSGGISIPLDKGGKPRNTFKADIFVIKPDGKWIWPVVTDSFANKSPVWVPEAKP